jgi:hypothetical protein
VFCPSCGFRLTPGQAFCAKCGRSLVAVAPLGPVGPTAPPGPQRVQLDFAGTGLEALGWGLLMIVAIPVVVPMAWVWAAVARWFCRNTTFSDGTQATFTGRGGEIWGWALLMGLLVWLSVGLNLALREEGFGAQLLVQLGISVITCAVGLQLLRWFFSSLDLTCGARPYFTGDYLSYLGWTLLIQISVYSIIGWAWSSTALYRWMCRHIEGGDFQVRFEGSGGGLLWRGLLLVLTALVIVPIPWMTVWLVRWLLQNVVIYKGQPARSYASY